VTERSKSVHRLLSALTLLAFAAPAASALASAPLLPPDGFLGAWKLAGPPKVYVGAQLYDYIDGGAEIFYELGFDRVTVQRYSAGADEIAVELYAMSDATAALGIYLGKCGQETPAAGLADRHTAGRHQLMLVRERYFLVVDNLSGKRERAPILVDFANTIARGLPATQPGNPLSVLSSADLIKGSERIIRGPLGLQAFILLGEGDILQLGGAVTAVAGRYREGADEHTLILVPFPDPARARAAFEHVTNHLDSEIKPLQASTSQLVFADYSKKYGVLALTGARLELTLGLAQPPSPR
jgi:hypothetical protein